jgi:hypothetical protein
MMNIDTTAPNNHSKRPLSSLSTHSMTLIFLIALLGQASQSLAFFLSANANEFGYGTFSTYSPRVKPTKTRVPGVASHHRLHYQNDGARDVQTTTRHPLLLSSIAGTTKWRISVVRPSSSSSDRSKEVDAYLDFLSKRYERVHKVKSQPPKKQPFSVTQWLRQQKHSNSSNRALYALGVAGLASERLLHNHGLPLRQWVVQFRTLASVVARCLILIKLFMSLAV